MRRSSAVPRNRRLDTCHRQVPPLQLVGPMCTNATLSEEQSMRLLTMILDGLRQSS